MSKNFLKPIDFDPKSISIEITKDYKGDGVSYEVEINDKLNGRKINFKFDNFSKNVEIFVNNNKVSFSFNDKNIDKSDKAMIGTMRSNIINAVNGFKESYTKKIYVNGLGYKIETSGNTIIFYLGKSHCDKIEVPSEIKFKVEKNFVTFTDHDKMRLNQFVSNVKKLRKINVYSCYGIIEQGQKLIKKSFKKVDTK